jgi:hypothetical protein
MIDFTMAEHIAREFINRLEWRGTHKPYAIMPGRTRTTPYGWVFFYGDATHVQTREDSDDGLLGPVPILVEKSDGSVHPLHPSGIPVEVLLAEYEASRTLPIRRTAAKLVYGLDARRELEAHLTLDQQQTLCGQLVLAVPPKSSTAQYCPACWPQARAAGLVCPVCEWGVLTATDPDWCWRCRLARRMGRI